MKKYQNLILIIGVALSYTTLLIGLALVIHRAQLTERALSKYHWVSPLPQYMGKEPTLLMEERGGKFRVIAKVHNPEISYDREAVDKLIKEYDDAVATRKPGGK